MKAGWEVKPLGEVCEKIQDGAHHSPKSALAVREPGTFPYVTSKNIRNWKLDTVNVSYVDAEFHNSIYPRCNAEFGDVLLTKDGSNTGQVTLNTFNEPISLLSSVCLIKTNREKLAPRFLVYYINSDLGFENITGQMTGAAIKRIVLKRIKASKIPVPPLEEQKRIVAVLDAAFDGLIRARTHIETNLQNAQELYQGFLQEIFRNDSDKWPCQTEQTLAVASTDIDCGKKGVRRSKQDTKTGGRAAAERHILGDFGLSVKVPALKARQGWKWSLLTDLARLESGHTPSRGRKDYWGGQIPWIGIKDARNNHGLTILETLENTNKSGIDNSSARILPKGTVCLSRTASVGYVAVMGRDMATSQDFVNWVCGEHLEPEFLKLILLAQGKELFKFSSGAVHQTIYFPEAKGFAICHPNVATQRQIVEAASAILERSKTLQAHYRTKLQDLDDLRQSLLQKAFAGELT